MFFFSNKGISRGHFFPSHFVLSGAAKKSLYSLHIPSTIVASKGALSRHTFQKSKKPSGCLWFCDTLCNPGDVQHAGDLCVTRKPDTPVFMQCTRPTCSGWGTLAEMKLTETKLTTVASRPIVSALRMICQMISRFCRINPTRLCQWL